ncbi:hypothetical protein ACVDFE_35850 [Lentzea chajnantorensis]
MKQFVVSPLVAFRLYEEHTCAGYLKARKAMVRLSARVASLSQLVRERPDRIDYRTVLGELVGRQIDAEQRTRLAYERWQRAQRQSDMVWMAQAKAAAGTPELTVAA